MNRVVVKRETAEDKSPGGILLPDVARQRKPFRGKVLSVGAGKRHFVQDAKQASIPWTTMPMEVKEGDVVLFAEYGGHEVEIGGEKLVILGEDDILAIVR